MWIREQELLECQGNVRVLAVYDGVGRSYNISLNEGAVSEEMFP